MRIGGVELHTQVAARIQCREISKPVRDFGSLESDFLQTTCAAVMLTGAAAVFVWRVGSFGGMITGFAVDE